MHEHGHVDKLYWKLFIGITAMHMLEDGIMVTFLNLHHYLYGHYI